MKRRALLAPAIALAERGFVLGQGDVDQLATRTADFARDPASAAIFLNHGQPFEVGQTLVQKDLARTLRAISRDGADGFYKGPVAAAIVASSQTGGGILTQADLDQYKTRELAPIECDYRGYHVVSAPPPSSGGIALCEMLNILEGYPLKSAGVSIGPGRALPDRGHAPCLRRSQPASWAIPDFVKQPGRAADRQGLRRIACEPAIDPQRAGCLARSCSPALAPHEGSNTTHYSIADQWGNTVAVTYTA